VISIFGAGIEKTGPYFGIGMVSIFDEWGCQDVVYRYRKHELTTQERGDQPNQSFRGIVIREPEAAPSAGTGALADGLLAGGLPRPAGPARHGGHRAPHVPMLSG
jgi:hypothetical protein